MDFGAESSVVNLYRSLFSGEASRLQLLYLFPRNYEFHRDEVVQLWMAHDLVPLPASADMEFCARAYFKEFEEHGVFQLSTLDYSVGQPRYKLSNSFVDLFSPNHGDDFFRIDDLNSRISKNTKHASLRDDNIDAVTLNELYKAERLATLLIVHQRGTHLDQLPDDLFLNLPLLRVLDLSHTSLTELPSFIGNLKDLRYFNLSYTPISALPNSLCTLYQMQTLKLKGCLKLLGLPKGMRKLVNLRHLEVDLDCLMVSMPPGLGDLAELRTLPAFVVGKENECHINELRNMINLCGTLSILRLDDVSSPVEAKEAALENKIHLQTVELHWTHCVDGLEVLENLQPHTELEELQIVGYGGSKFPNWIGEPIFSKLATMTICDCRNCEMLPPVGKLPSLQHLSLSDMQAVKTINSSFCAKNRVAGLLGFKILPFFRSDDHHMFKSFQSLEKLTLNRMPMLETWSGIEEGDFPNLQKLNISHCPKLTSLPELSLLISLQQLEISLCPLLESFPNKGLPTSLQCLVIIDCPRLKALLGRQDWVELGHIPYVWIDYQQIQANSSSTAVNSPLPSQNLETTVQVQLDTNVEKGKRAGLDSFTMTESHANSEKRQVENLNRKAQLQEVELERTSKQLKEAIAVAGEEAAKCKAAKEVIKSLTAQLKDMAERLPMGVVRNTKATSFVSFGSSPASGDLSAAANDRLGSPVNIQDLDSNGSSNLVHSNEATNAGNQNSNHNKVLHPEPTKNGSRTPVAEPNQEGEWVEQVEPGVYITLTVLPGGVKDLKRIRYSRKRFSEKQAEQWWAENRAWVYELYNVRVADRSSVRSGSEELAH